MRKFLFCVIAAVLGVSLSGFNYMSETKKGSLDNAKAWQQTTRYAVFNLGTTTGEKVFSNYTVQVPVPAASRCPGTDRVCWIRLTDRNGDGVINVADFTIIVNELDTDSDGVISDDQNEDHISYEEKAPGTR